MGNFTNQIKELNSNPLILGYKLIPKKHPFSHLLSESLRIWGEDAHRFEISLEVKVQIENVMLVSFPFSMFYSDLLDQMPCQGGTRKIKMEI